MNLHSDYSERVVLNHHDLPWVASPEAGVKRRLLDRCGGEVARATSVVCYQPDAAFPKHTHELGEEIFVLEGVLSNETGDYPAGAYIITPQGRVMPHLAKRITPFL